MVEGKVAETCQAAGMQATCAADKTCKWNNPSMCLVTHLTTGNDCNYPMWVTLLLSKIMIPHLFNTGISSHKNCVAKELKTEIVRSCATSSITCTIINHHLENVELFQKKCQTQGTIVLSKQVDICLVDLMVHFTGYVCSTQLQQLDKFILLHIT